MTGHTVVHQKHSSFRGHLLLGLTLLLGGVVITYWPAARMAAWAIIVASVATHLGLALVAFFGIQRCAGNGAHLWPSTRLPGGCAGFRRPFVG